MQDDRIQANVTITVEPNGQKLVVKRSTNLLSALRLHGFFTMEKLCNGAGQCGNCRVIYDDGTCSRSVQACKITVCDDCKVEIPGHNDRLNILQRSSLDLSREDEPIVRYVTIKQVICHNSDSLWEGLRHSAVESGSLQWTASLPVLRTLAELGEIYDELNVLLADHEVVDVHTGPNLAPIYGIAVDMGTTTIVAYLYELRTQKLLAVESDVNPQIAVAADLISRIHLASTKHDGTDELAKMVRMKLNSMFTQVTAKAQIKQEAVQEIVVAGNTCMQHLLLGVSPNSLGRAPFSAVFEEAIYCAPPALELQMKATARIYCMPCIGGFVGGDALAVMVACFSPNVDNNCLAIDMGTNCEIMLAASGVFYACSAAAGPAFEGGAIEQGMRAVAGAIDKVFMSKDGQISVHVIDEAPPRGICGSGIVDAVAVLLAAGVVDASGRMLLRAEAESAGFPPALIQRLRESNGVPGFALTDSVVLSQQDIRQVQLAKAAIGAGIRILIETAAIDLEKLDEVFLAGAFGNYLSLDSAVRIGIVPEILRERIQLAGNAAGVGACRVLLSRTARRQAEQLGKVTKHVSLATHPRFTELYMETLAFPDLRWD